MSPGIYFFHSAALPGIYLSPCVYLSLALIWINTVQELILKAAKQQDYQTEFDFIIDYYGDDFDAALLKTHLEIFSANMQSEGRDATLSDVIEFFKAKNTIQQDFISQVCKLLRLLLVMPVTNATSERSFSALRRIKT